MGAGAGTNCGVSGAPKDSAFPGARASNDDSCGRARFYLCGFISIFDRVNGKIWQDI